MTLRRFFTPLAAIAVIVAIVLGVGWWVILDTMRGQIEDAIAGARGAGYEVAYDDLDIGGNPWRMAITLTRLSVARPESAGVAPWRWSTPRLSAETRFFGQPTGVILTVPETQRLDFDGRIMEMTVQRGVVHYRPAGVTPESLAPESLAIDAGGIALATPRGLFTLDSLTGLIQRSPESQLGVEIDGRGLTLSPQALASDAKKILGREIGLIGITVSHDGPLPEDLSGAALAAWSAAGGTVEFERLNLEWGALEIAAGGTLTLDGELRPEAAFSAEIAGYGALLDGLAESGRMKPRDASFAKTFLNLMARKKSGRRVIETPITAQDGRLFIGPLPLFKLAAWF